MRREQDKGKHGTGMRGNKWDTHVRPLDAASLDDTSATCHDLGKGTHLSLPSEALHDECHSPIHTKA